MKSPNPLGGSRIHDWPESPAPTKMAGRRGVRESIKARSVRRYSVIGASILAFIIALADGPTNKFLYDADAYWASANALATGGNAFAAGGLNMRGALSTAVYLPASTASLLSGVSPFIAVLIQNALLIAVLGAFLLPRIASFLVTISAKHVWVSAILCSVLLSGFAPYPLMDLWALALVLLGVILVMSGKSPWLLGAGGLAFAVAINLRPAYLVPVALAGLVWMIFHWRKAHWPAIGAVLGFVPQSITNAVFAGSWKPWPLSMSRISDIQAQYAGYAVRYDTYAYFEGAPAYLPGGSPQQFFCSPVMAEALGDIRPKGTGDILAFFAGNLPDSVLFMAQKVAASLNWTPATPYLLVPSSGIGALAVLVALISAAGVLALVWHLVTRQPGSPAAPLVLLAVWLGSAATLAGSTPEARFALPIVMIGVIGSLSVVSRLPKQLRATPPALYWAGGTALMVVLLLWLGSTGLSHPAPPGDVTATVCRLN